MNKLKTLLGLLLLATGSFAQFPGCPDVDAGADATLTCADPCVNLTATPFHSGATDTYSVAAIPHTPPIAYNAPGGTAVSVNTDDVWSPIINLPFTFCFYGQNYNTVKVGSNGALQLGPTTNGGNHPWSFTASVPSTNLTAAGQIFGIYHDIDPSVAGTVNWYVTGAAPCRIFVVSYNNLGHFSCTSLRSTFMMVLYETTNAIDVYVQQKETCAGWNGGRAVIGIQNPAGTQGIAAPGRNTGAWTVSTPEAWRFTPNGAPIYSVEWFDGANSIGTGNTVNVCPAVPTSYTSVATYLSCDGQTIVVQDDVLVTPPADAPVVALDNMIPATCGGSNGELQVSASGGNPGYQFSIDGVNFQGAGTFTGLAEGSYTITAEDATGCLGAQTFEVTNSSTLDLNFTFTNVSCFGADDGEITLSGVAGSGGYTYSLNGGAPQGSGVFSGLTSGTYDIQVTDSDGCVESDQVEIIEPIELILDLIDSQNISCFGETDGFITVEGSGGTAPLSFDVNGGVAQASGAFTNLGADNYAVTVTDASGCSVTLNVSLTEPTPVSTSVEYEDSPYCAIGAASILQSGVTGGTYSSTTGLVLNVTTGEIDLANSIPGVYTVTYSYNDNGCPYTSQTNIEVLALPLIDAGLDTTLCEGEDYVLNGQGGVSYLWDNGITNGVNFAPSLGSVTYTVIGTDANGCQNTSSVTITVNPTPNVEFTATPGGGIAPLEVDFENISTGATNYSWNFGNGSSSNSSNQFVNTIYTDAGSYTVTLTGEENGCTDSHSIVIIVEFDPPVFDIPNVFSPNSDGSNDYFLLINTSGLEHLVEFEMVILNRWGNVVNTFNDPFFKWDGTTEGGKNVTEGTYFYKLTAVGYDGEEIMKHGFIQLVRGK
jgi:large repetitive protein